MNIAAMARKFLALLLIMISWFSVAGFDILEDPNRSEFYSSRAARLPDHRQTTKLTESFIGSVGHSRLRYFRFIELCGAPLLIGSTAPWQKLYKVHNCAVPRSSIGIAHSRIFKSSFRTASAE
jgi:hypothetical protein